MKNLIELNPKDMINSSLLFFVVLSTQIGVGIHGFQRIVYLDAKHDAWISVLLAGAATSISAFFMIKTLDIYKLNDLYGIQLDVFGKWVGNFLNLLYSLYCATAFFSILSNYIEVVHTWIFPNLDTWFITVTLLLIVIYTFTGGLRVMVGISFLTFILTIWLLPLLLFSYEFFEWNNLSPVLETDIMGIFKGVKSMTFTIIGFEILNMIYPFVKDKSNIKKYVHSGLVATTLIYTSILLISLAYFGGEQLSRLIWATLSLFNTVKFPFIERFEFVVVCFWMLIILPTLCFYLWASYRGTIRLVTIKATKFGWIFSFLMLIASLLLTSRSQINSVNNSFSQIAFYVVFVYPVLLYMSVVFKRKFTSRKGLIE